MLEKNVLIKSRLCWVRIRTRKKDFGEGGMFSALLGT